MLRAAVFVTAIQPTAEQSCHLLFLWPFIRIDLVAVASHP